MISPAGTPGTQAAGSLADAKLRKAAQDLEGVFLGHVFQAMQDTVPKDGMFQDSGQEMFTGMLNDKFANLEAQHLQHGLGDALYRQLRPHVTAAATPPVR